MTEDSFTSSIKTDHRHKELQSKASLLTLIRCRAERPQICLPEMLTHNPFERQGLQEMQERLLEMPVSGIGQQTAATCDEDTYRRSVERAENEGMVVHPR